MDKIIGIAFIYLIVGVFVFLSVKFYKKLKSIQEIQSILIRDITAGQKVEVNGVVKAKELLTAPFSKKQCVYYEYQIQKMETQTDGKQGMRSEKQNYASLPFILQDSTGLIKIDPVGATLEGGSVFEKILSQGDVLDNKILQVLENITPNIEKYYVKEVSLLPEQEVYILGQARQGIMGLEIGKGEGDFIISTKSENELKCEYRNNYIIFLILSVLLFVFGLFFIIQNL